MFVVAAIGSVLSCSGMPSLEEQERHVRANELVLNQLTPRAFVGAWGPADVSAYRVHAVLRHERRLADSTVEVGDAENHHEGGRSVLRLAMGCFWLTRITGGWWYFSRNGLSIAKR